MIASWECLTPNFVDQGGGQAVGCAHIRHEYAEHGAESEEEDELSGLASNATLNNVEQAGYFCFLIVEKRHALGDTDDEGNNDQRNESIDLESNHQDQEERNSERKNE